jgi:serine protease inhibitor
MTKCVIIIIEKMKEGNNMTNNPLTALKNYYDFEIRTAEQVIQNTSLVPVAEIYINNAKSRCLGALTLYQTLDTELSRHTIAEYYHDKTIKALDEIAEKNKIKG